MDDLNLGDTPPPGAPGSEFTDLTKFDGLILTPGESLLTVPEPSTWAMMKIGFVGLGLAGYRQPARTSPPELEHSIKMKRGRHLAASFLLRTSALPRCAHLTAKG